MHAVIVDDTLSGTTAERDAWFQTGGGADRAPKAGDRWDNTTVGYRQEYDAATGTWGQTRSGGKPLVHVAAQDNMPHTQRYVQKVTARTAAALMTTSDVSHIHNGTFTISGLTSETVALTAVREDVTGLPVQVEALDGTKSSGAALGNGTYKLTNFSADVLAFTKSAATEAVTLTFQGHP